MELDIILKTETHTLFKYKDQIELIHNSVIEKGPWENVDGWVRANSCFNNAFQKFYRNVVEEALKYKKD